MSQTTTPVRNHTRKLLATLTVVPLLAALVACSSSAAEPISDGQNEALSAAGLTVNTTPEQDRIKSTVSPEAVALLPKEIAESGKLKVAVFSGAPPLSFLADDERTPIGSETDIAALLADSLGLELELDVKAWADWPLAIQSGDVSAVTANITVTEERKELFDFATYRNDVLGWLVQADSEITSITEPKDIAGTTVAVGSGTNQEKILIDWDEQNQAAGLEPVNIEYFDNDGDTILALQSGRIDINFGPNATSAFKSAVAPDQFKVVGTLSGGWPQTAQIAVASLKGNELAPAFAAALNHTIEEGTYAQVLERWGLSSEAIALSEVNPAGLPKP